MSVRERSVEGGVPAELSRVSVRELWAGRTGARVLWLDTGLVDALWRERPVCPPVLL